MHIVDTHCHVGLDKYEPVEALLDHMDRSGVAQAVLIQHMGHTDNAYHVECLRRFPGRLASAMLVPADDDGTLMRSWAEQGCAGIRLRPTARATGTDPLIQWRTAAELDLAVSVLCRPAELLSPAFTQVLGAFPELRIVVEHLAGVGKDDGPPYSDFSQALELARRPALYMKVPGLGEYCALPYPFASIPPLLDMALEAFGPQRLMWGSDFPPVSSREGYDNALQGPLAQLDSLSDDERAWVFGRTAAEVWGLAPGG